MARMLPRLHRAVGQGAGTRRAALRAEKYLISGICNRAQITESHRWPKRCAVPMAAMEPVTLNG